MSILDNVYTGSRHTGYRRNAENSVGFCNELSGRSSKREESPCLSQNEANSGLYGTRSFRSLSRSASSRKLLSSKLVSEKISHSFNDRPTHSEQALEKPNSSLEDSRGQRESLSPNSAKVKNDKQPPEKRTHSAKKPPIKAESLEKCADSPKLQVYTKNCSFRRESI